MQKSALLAAIQKEIHRHDLSYFVDEPPSVAQGGKGLAVPGRPGMQKADQYDDTISESPGERRDA
jgi:hypothetical protein